MRKLILTTLLVTGASLGAFAQGTIFANNLKNTGVYGGAGGTPFTGASGNPTYSPLVISNGLIFTSDPTAQAGNNGYTAGSTMMGVDFNWALYGGATAGTATTFIVGEVGTNGAAAGDNANFGQLSGPGSQQYVPGTAGAGTGFLDLQVWEGTATSYATSTSYKADSGAFANPMGGGLTPPLPLYGLPEREPFTSTSRSGKARQPAMGLQPAIRRTVVLSQIRRVLVQAHRSRSTDYLTCCSRFRNRAFSLCPVWVPLR